MRVSHGNAVSINRFLLLSSKTVISSINLEFHARQPTCHTFPFNSIQYTRSSPVFHDILGVRQNFPVICKNGSINVTLEGLHNTVADFYVSEIISRAQKPQVLRTKYTKVMNCIPINYFE